ncbi:hypothetical protein BGX21_003559 [Mortierella sp. AD011]|nr:hypothetical protein BGX20_002979 [Mortierella sp. AD010]KAF9376175.1 hypothetical protein BGX21_003559 [Mortierella sp. AD011]
MPPRKQEECSWRAELRGLSTQDYFITCTRISAIDYRGYLTFTSKDDGYSKRQSHRDWQDIINHLLRCKHPGLVQKGKELQQKWSDNVYKHMDDLHWALQERKRTAKLHSVAITSLTDASVNNTMKQMLREEIEGKCVLCLFQEYQKVSIQALFAKEIKKVDVADAIATFGVFAPYAATERMRSVFGESRLENVSPTVRLQVEEEYDLCVLKAIRAFEALENIKDRKIRVMFEMLIEHLPLDKESRAAEVTFVATYIAPILLGTLRANDKVSIHFPNTKCTTQKGQGMRADRPDIIVKLSGRELLIGEVIGPFQETHNAKNAWDLYRLARFGKSLLGDNPFAPLIQIVHNKGDYMRLTIKARGMFLMERVGAFVIPTSINMLLSLLGTIQTLSATKVR